MEKYANPFEFQEDDPIIACVGDNGGTYNMDIKKGFQRTVEILKCRTPWRTMWHWPLRLKKSKRRILLRCFDWGGYYEKDGKTLLPFSAQVHHSFVDGVHIGKLTDKLQSCLNIYEC